MSEISRAKALEIARWYWADHIVITASYNSMYAQIISPFACGAIGTIQLPLPTVPVDAAPCVKCTNPSLKEE